MNRCACCEFPVRDGHNLCPVCAGTVESDFILKDGMRVYAETKLIDKPCSEQLELYQLLFDCKKPFTPAKPTNPLRPYTPYQSKYFIDRRFDQARPITADDIYKAMDKLDLIRKE